MSIMCVWITTQSVTLFLYTTKHIYLYSTLNSHVSEDNAGFLTSHHSDLDPGRYMIISP